MPIRLFSHSMHMAGCLCLALLVGCAVPPPVVREEPLPVFPPPPETPRFYYERTLYGSADVERKDPHAALKQALFGGTTQAEGLGKPYGVAVFHGRVYVGDTGNRSVAVFDIPGQRFFRIGQDGAGQLSMPMGLDVDGQGQLYVVDNSARVVQVYDALGQHLRTLAPDPAHAFLRPSGLAVDAAGERVYVVDTGGIDSERHRVSVLDARSGRHLFDIGKRGTGPGEFNLPRDVTLGQDGLLYVVDGGNFRVQVFQEDGRFVRTFGAIGRQGGQFSRPKEAATDAQGHVYIVDAAFGNFQVFTPEGALLLSVGSRSERDGRARYMLPSGIAVDGDGRVYLVDQFFRKVDVFRPAGLAADAGFAVRR